jgi:hypothetical protein
MGQPIRSTRTAGNWERLTAARLLERPCRARLHVVSPTIREFPRRALRSVTGSHAAAGEHKLRALSDDGIRVC